MKGRVWWCPRPTDEVGASPSTWSSAVDLLLRSDCTGINAPPVSFSINGKQYIAVLAGSLQKAAVMLNSPELKNTSTASMLFVFAL
jgi:hypothetical protein